MLFLNDNISIISVVIKWRVICLVWIITIMDNWARNGWVQTNGWIKSTCTYCGVGCGIEARPTSLGKLEVRGDKIIHQTMSYVLKGLRGDTVTPLGRLTQPAHIQNERSKETELEQCHSVGRQTNSIKRSKNLRPIQLRSIFLSGQLLTEDYYTLPINWWKASSVVLIDDNSRLCMASTGRA